MRAVDRRLEAKVLALEYALGLAFALIYKEGKYPSEAVGAFHDDILAHAAQISVGGADPADTDLRSAEFHAELEKMLRGFEHSLALVQVEHG